MSAKVSLKFKVLCYTVMNFSTFFFSATAAIQERMSLQRGLIIYLAAAACINLFFWYAFRSSDKAAGTAALQAGDRAHKTPPANSLTEGHKVLCYALVNLSTPVFAAVAAIRGRLSIQTGLIIYVVSAAWINFLFWFLFRMRDKADRKAGRQVE